MCECSVLLKAVDKVILDGSRMVGKNIAIFIDPMGTQNVGEIDRFNVLLQSSNGLPLSFPN